MSKVITVPMRSDRKNGSSAIGVEDVSNLEGIPYLGPSRRAALANAGFLSQQDLRVAPVEQIGGVKGVGMIIAKKVKDWLSAQDDPPAAVKESPQTSQAESQQYIQDTFGKLEAATSRLKDKLPAKRRDKSLDRQLAKLDVVASELAEGPDTLSAKQIEAAVKTLDKIAALLETAAAGEKLSPKKQSLLIEDLRSRRKRLQKSLGD